MKIKLSVQDDIHILTLTGDVTEHNFDVLHAGIKKLFRDGKNKLLLDLSAINELENSVIRKLAHLNVTARELSGEIALGGLKSELGKRVKNFAVPPLIFCFEQVVDAVNQLKEVHRRDNQEDVTETLKKALKQKEGEIDSLKNMLAKKMTAPDTSLADRTQLSELKNENENLKNKLRDLVLERRSPPNSDDALQIKLKMLEEQLTKVISAISAPKTAKSK